MNQTRFDVVISCSSTVMSLMSAKDHYMVEVAVILPGIILVLSASSKPAVHGSSLSGSCVMLCVEAGSEASPPTPISIVVDTVVMFPGQQFLAHEAGSRLFYPHESSLKMCPKFELALHAFATTGQRLVGLVPSPTGLKFKGARFNALKRYRSAGYIAIWWPCRQHRSGAELFNLVEANPQIELPERVTISGQHTASRLAFFADQEWSGKKVSKYPCL